MNETDLTIEQAQPSVEVIEMSYLELLTGPLSALALALIMIYTIGRWLARFVPSVVEKYMEQSDKTIEQLERLSIKTSFSIERKAFLSSLCNTGPKFSLNFTS